MFLYDGDCGFCTSTGRWLDRTVARGRFDVRPGQAVELAPLGLTPAHITEAAWFVPADGRPRRGHEAIAAALREGVVPWRPLGAVLLAPGVTRLAAVVYAWVAGHRHLLPGSAPACATDPPDPAGS